MNITHVNVRLSEGGAAMVARTLASEQRTAGHHVDFIYGYGERGNSSPLESDFQATRITSKPRAAANLLAHRYLGHELVQPAIPEMQQMNEVFASSDVIHLHVIHSYFLEPIKLLRNLAESGKPVVWTLHDQWAMTGRCAQPGTCDKWKEGCPTCPNLNAYPPSRVDRASRGWDTRRDAIRQVASTGNLRIVACANWLAQEAMSAGFENVEVVHNSVDTALWEELDATTTEPKHDLLFMCRDMRDEVKVDWDILKRLGVRFGERMTIVGDNSPHQLSGVRHKPSVTDRGELAKTLKQHKRLLFTSKVDYYPLTVIEALAAGMQVFAMRSPAATELAGHAGMHVFDSPDEIVNALTHDMGSSESESKDYFAPHRMADEYSAIYSSMTSRP